MVPCPTNKLSHVEIGPMTMNVAGTINNNVKVGIKKALATLGITFAKNFSTFAAKNAEMKIGITDVEYVNKITGIPANVIKTGDSNIVPVNNEYSGSP